MNDLTIHDIDERTLGFLRKRARELGQPIELVARELLQQLPKLSPPRVERGSRTISKEERGERERMAAELAELRSRTLKPFTADSTLIVREMRDSR